MTAPTVATARVAIVPELDDTALRGLADSIKSSIATELRKLADELAGPEKDAPAERYVLVRDRAGDYSIHDREEGYYIEYFQDSEEARHDLARLRAGLVAPGALERPSEPGRYGPYEEVPA